MASRASKNQPGLRPSPQPNDSVPVAPVFDPATAFTPEPPAPVRNVRAELDEAEKDLARIKHDVSAPDHAIRAAQARVQELRDLLGR